MLQSMLRRQLAGRLLRVPHFAVRRNYVRGVRPFLQTAHRVISIDNSMSETQAEVLHEYMTRFERDTNEMENAYKLFRELNKYGMHLTVLRLYFKH